MQVLNFIRCAHDSLLVHMFILPVQMCSECYDELSNSLLFAYAFFTLKKYLVSTVKNKQTLYTPVWLYLAQLTLLWFPRQNTFTYHLRAYFYTNSTTRELSMCILPDHTSLLYLYTFYAFHDQYFENLGAQKEHFWLSISSGAIYNVSSWTCNESI